VAKNNDKRRHQKSGSVSISGIMAQISGVAADGISKYQALSGAASGGGMA